MRLNNFFYSIGLIILYACSSSPIIDVDDNLRYCDEQIHKTLDDLHSLSGGIDYTMMPRYILKGEKVWNLRKATKSQWTSGFWPGILWYDYEATGNDSIRKEADKFTRSLEFFSGIPACDHDLGFLIFCSYGNGYRLTLNLDYK